MQRKWFAYFAVMTVGFVAITVFGSKYFSHFFFIFLYLFFVAILVPLRFARFKLFFFNLSFVFLSFFIFEAYLNLEGFSVGTTQSGTYSKGGYFVSDPVKGYGAPRRASQYSSTKRFKTGELIYNVAYTIDEHGLRVTPDSVPNHEHPAYFFGCSFTIGEGLRDEETLPYVYSLRSGVKTYNFGFHGYGPHQMLRMLETDYIRDIDPRKPSIAFYNAIAVHIERAAGLEVWDKDGPNYILDGTGVKYSGRFSDGHVIEKMFDKVADKSLIYRKVIRPRIYRRRSSDLDRYVAIVESAARLMEQMYETKLVVVLWDVFGDRSDASDADSSFIYQALIEKGIRVVRVSEVLGHDDYKRYYIPGDGHPNAAGIMRVADLLIRSTSQNHQSE